MTLRDRLSAFKISAQAAGTRIAIAALVTFAAVVGGSGVGLISKWPTLRSHPLAATGLTVLLGISLVVCSWALGRLRRHSNHPSGRLDAPDNEYEAIFSRALDATLVLDDSGKCLRANPAAAELLGLTETELSGCPLNRLAALIPDIQRELLESGIMPRKARVHRPDGASRMVESLLIQDGASRRRILFLRDITEHENAAAALRENQERFLQMASNIGEIFWMLDPASRKILYISPAYETITGRTCRDLYDAPTSYEELFHPEDRIRVLTRIDEATRTGLFDEEFRIMRPDGAVRWVWLRGFPVRDQQGRLTRLVGTAQDITVRKSAESSLATQLRLTETARTEAEALRKSALALTQTLNMEAVLSTLLECLAQLVPYDLSNVLLLEDQTRLFVVGGRRPAQSDPSMESPEGILTIDVSAYPILKRLMKSRQTTCVANTRKTPEWVDVPSYENARSWLGVPLVAGTRVIGMLCLGKSEPNAFTGDHIRFAESIATPAAIAIQNARLFERGEIYATELEQRVNDLRQAQEALRDSEDTYRDLVENSVDLICTHTLEGKLLSVNELPVKLLGYSREELLNKPMRNFLLPEARAQFDESLVKIKKDGFVKGLMVVLTKTGERRIWEYHNTLRTDGVSTPIVRGIAHDVTEQRRMQKALRLSEEKFSKAFHLSPVAKAIATLAEGKLLDVNAAFEKQFGYSREEAIGRTAVELGMWTDPDERARVVNELKEQGSVRGLRLTFRKKSGERVIHRYSAERIELEGQPCILAVGQDITESELAQKLIAGENRVLEMIAQGKALPLNLYALCQVIEEQAEGGMCSTSLLDEEKDTLYCVAAPGLPDDFKSVMDGLPIGPRQGSGGTAAFRREFVAVVDILTDSLWDDYRHLATAHGLRACWSAPIFSSRQRVIGTFDMYFKEPRSPNDRELALIARAKHIAGIATERYSGGSVFRVVAAS
jgi:PAS domain S-box-containing protein